MRAALALMMLAAASCSNPEPGMRLEILAGQTGAISIELYLGTRPCAGCDNKIAPKNVREKLEGEVWYLDGSAATGTPNTAAQLVDGRYVYDLRTPDPEKDARIAHILVVGYDAQNKVVGVGTLGDAPIYHAATEWYRLTLRPATGAPSSDATQPKGERVYVWHRFDKDVAACVGYEQATDSGVERRWFVPEDDTDCDAIDLDCDLFAYHANGTADIDEASCVTAQFAVPGAANKSCLLGGPACIDGAGRMDTCGPVGPSYCLPDAICSNVGCAQNLGLCLRDGQGSLVPRIKCDIPYNQQANGMPCVLTQQQRHGAIDLKSLLASPTNPNMALTGCKSILFADPALGMVNVQNKIAMGNIEIKPDPIDPPCSWGMTWVTGNVTSIGGNVAPIIRITVVELMNGNRMLVPIEVNFRPMTCSTADAMTCGLTVTPTDGITRCAQSQP